MPSALSYVSFAVIAYTIGLIVFSSALTIKKYSTKPIPPMKLTKYGLIFFSHAHHKIKVGEVKLLQVDNVIYLKSKRKTVVLKNVNDVFLKRGYLYFTAQGVVKIIFNAKSYYKYFNIDIKSSLFDLSTIKNNALNEMLDNLFNLSACGELKRYLKIVIDILNIKITNDKVIVKRNKFNLTFQLIYKLNNVVKKVNIGETL